MQAGCVRGSQLPGPELPQPVALARAGHVHPRLAAETEEVLRLDDRELGAGGERGLRQLPVRLPPREAGRGALFAGERAPPPDRRVAVVRAGVDDRAARVVLEP